MLTDEERKKVYEEEEARIETQEALRRRAKPRNTGLPCWAIVPTVVAVVVGLYCISIDLSKGGAGQKSGPDKLGAWFISQKFVNDKLKAPATASYPSYDEPFVVDLGGGKFRVAAYVDAENSFGAKIRSRFTCTETSTDGTKWHLEDIYIE